MFGKSVSVVSYFTTDREVEVASLGKYPGQCYEIKYENGKFDSGQGDSVDMVVISGPINFCVTNAIRRTTCDTIWGEIMVTIKPANLEQTCAAIRSKEQEDIQNLPSTFSYMLKAL